MPKKIKPLSLQRDEDRLFRKLYIKWRIPRGQFKKHRDYLSEFVRAWNQLSGRSDTDSDVLHYMETQQKITSRLYEPWPKFDGAHKRLPPLVTVMSEEHLTALRALYASVVLPVDIGSDGLSYRDDLMDSLSKEFFKLTNLSVPGPVLAAICESERKGGRLPTIRDSAFGDLDKLMGG
jgi:hypothetical protein